MKSVLTIAGSDSSGGAGIQADIKTISMHGVYASSVITALTAQNTLGVREIYDISPQFLAHQLDCVFEDIYPDAIKIGMLGNHEMIDVVAKKLVQYGAKNIVLDPVMVATSGSRLINEDAISSMIEKLFPLTILITPNTMEAEILGRMKIGSIKDQKQCANQIFQKWNTNVLLKGGHLSGNAFDVLVCGDGEFGFEAPRSANKNTHGTGCTLSSAIASNLALGYDLQESIQRSKDYLTRAIMANLNLGKGRGPINHLFGLMK